MIDQYPMVVNKIPFDQNQNRFSGKRLTIAIIIITLLIIYTITVYYFLVLRKSKSSNTSQTVTNGNSTSENKLLPLKPLQASNDSETQVLYTETYPGIVNRETSEQVLGFYANQVADDTNETQLFLYGTVQEWDHGGGRIKIQTDYGVVELKADPDGIFYPPKTQGRLIQETAVPSFLNRRVTLWLDIINGQLFTDQLAVTVY